MNEPELRSCFPVTRHWTYLNHASVGPLALPAAERMAELAHLVAATGDRRWPERNAAVEVARAAAARLLGAADPHCVAFVENTATGLSLVAEGLPWSRGDNAVTADCEYPANVYPWMNLGRRGVELRLVPAREDGRVDPGDLMARVDGRTRVLALSWVQYATGFRSDLAALSAACRDRGVLFVVDVAQGLGALVLDVEAQGVDVAATTGHKWLLGPEGSGILYLSERARQVLAPARAGARSVARPFDWERLELDFTPGALAWECGTLNVYGILGLGAALELLLALGPRRIEDRVLAHAGRLAEGLAAAGYRLASPRGPGEMSGIVSLAHPRRNAEEVAAAAARQGVVVSARAGRVRLSPHVYNSAEDIERAVAVLSSL